MIGDTTSDFVFERLFKLNSTETTGHTKVRVIRRLVTSQLKVPFRNCVCDREKQFLAKT